MHPTSSIPEVSVQEVAARLQNDTPVILLDVREAWEVDRVHLTGSQVLYAPMSKLVYEGFSALPDPVKDPAAEVIVICHHGVRSANVTGWLRGNGWTKVFSMRGGVDAYAIEVDPSIGQY